MTTIITPTSDKSIVQSILQNEQTLCNDLTQGKMTVQQAEYYSACLISAREHPVKKQDLTTGPLSNKAIYKFIHKLIAATNDPDIINVFMKAYVYYRFKTTTTKNNIIIFETIGNPTKYDAYSLCHSITLYPDNETNDKNCSKISCRVVFIVYDMCAHQNQFTLDVGKQIFDLNNKIGKADKTIHIDTVAAHGVDVETIRNFITTFQDDKRHEILFNAVKNTYEAIKLNLQQDLPDVVDVDNIKLVQGDLIIGAKDQINTGKLKVKDGAIYTMTGIETVAEMEKQKALMDKTNTVIGNVIGFFAPSTKVSFRIGKDTYVDSLTPDPDGITRDTEHHLMATNGPINFIQTGPHSEKDVQSAIDNPDKYVNILSCRKMR